MTRLFVLAVITHSALVTLPTFGFEELDEGPSPPPCSVDVECKQYKTSGNAVRVPTYCFSGYNDGNEALKECVAKWEEPNTCPVTDNYGNKLDLNIGSPCPYAIPGSASLEKTPCTQCRDEAEAQWKNIHGFGSDLGVKVDTCSDKLTAITCRLDTRSIRVVEIDPKKTTV